MRYTLGKGERRSERKAIEKRERVRVKERERERERGEAPPLGNKSTKHAKAEVAACAFRVGLYRDNLGQRKEKARGPIHV